MSTLGSEYNTLSGVLTRDFYKTRVNPDASDRQQVFFGRVATLLIGALTVVLAIVVSYFQQLHLMDIIVRIFASSAVPVFDDIGPMLT